MGVKTSFFRVSALYKESDMPKNSGERFISVTQSAYGVVMLTACKAMQRYSIFSIPGR